MEDTKNSDKTEEKPKSKIRSKSPRIPNHAFIEFKKQLPRFDILHGQPLPYDSSFRKSQKLPKLNKKK